MLLAAELYAKDTLNVGDNDPNNTGNTSLWVRSEAVKGGRSIEMESVPLEDIFSIKKYMLNSVDMYLKCYRNSSSFILMTPDNTNKYRFLIEEATLKVLKIKLDPGVVLAHENQLERDVVRYYFTKSDVKTHTVAQYSTSLCWCTSHKSYYRTYLLICTQW